MQYLQGTVFHKPLGAPIIYSHDTIRNYTQTAPNAQELLFVGRSNVGKSSLLNALTNQEAALTSKTPVGSK